MFEISRLTWTSFSILFWNFNNFFLFPDLIYITTLTSLVTASFWRPAIFSIMLKFVLMAIWTRIRMLYPLLLAVIKAWFLFSYSKIFLSTTLFEIINKIVHISREFLFPQLIVVTKIHFLNPRFAFAPKDSPDVDHKFIPSPCNSKHLLRLNRCFRVSKLWN